MMLVFRKLFLAALAISVLTGCATSQTVGTDADIKAINHGTIDLEGMRITPEHGSSFELTSSGSWKPPYHQGQGCLVNPTADNYGDALDADAQKVRVDHPDHPEPLYGVLSFCGRVPGARGAAARSYQLVVPASYIQQTSDGRATVIYEFQQFNSPERENSYAEAQAKSWILWLSRVPMDASSGRAEGKTLRKALGKYVHESGSRFFRFTGGLIYAGARVDDYAPKYSLGFSGTEFSLAIGSSVVENLAWHLTTNVTYASFTAEDIEFDAANEGDEYNLSQTSYARATLGLGFTYHFWENFYVSSSGGAAFGKLMVGDADTGSLGKGPGVTMGIAFEGIIGKDWWVSPNWGLGLAGTISRDFGLAGVDGGDPTIVGLRLSATYN